MADQILHPADTTEQDDCVAQSRDERVIEAKRARGYVKANGNALHMGMRCIALTEGIDRHANARHLAALWNEADKTGLSTEALEQGVISDLLAALRDVVADHIDRGVTQATINKARRALALATTDQN